MEKETNKKKNRGEDDTREVIHPMTTEDRTREKEHTAKDANRESGTTRRTGNNRRKVGHDRQALSNKCKQPQQHKEKLNKQEIR